MSEVRLTVHRATNQIGGNCIEIAAGDNRILLDAGRPLDAPNDATGLLPTTLDLKAPMDGILISHPHQDHYGLLEETPRGWPIFCGEATKRLIQLTSEIFGDQRGPGSCHRWTLKSLTALATQTVNGLLRIWVHRFRGDWPMFSPRHLSRGEKSLKRDTFFYETAHSLLRT